MGKVIINSVRFERELNEQLSWIAAESPSTARRMSKRILDAMTLLSDNPELGREGRLQGTRK